MKHLAEQACFLLFKQRCGLAALTITLGLLISACSAHPGHEIRKTPAPSPTSAADDAAGMPLMTVEEQLNLLAKSVSEEGKPALLGKSDVIALNVYGEPDLSFSRLTIRPDGYVSIPLIGDVLAHGISVDELKTTIEAGLARYILTPRVSVIVLEINSLNFTIQGEVVRPGIYPLKRDITISEAIAQAGGLNKGVFRATSIELADLAHASIVRGKKTLPVDFVKLLRGGDMRFDVKLMHGDIITIPSGLTQEVYILGEVNRPAIFAFKENMPMSRTLALAQGFTHYADLSRIHIVRGTLSNPELTVADFNKIIIGQQKDIRLEPGDIVFVPATGLSTWARIVNQIAPSIQALNTGVILSRVVD